MKVGKLDIWPQKLECQINRGGFWKAGGVGGPSPIVIAGQRGQKKGSNPRSTWSLKRQLRESMSLFLVSNEISYTLNNTGTFMKTDSIRQHCHQSLFCRPEAASPQMPNSASSTAEDGVTRG